MHKWMWQWVVVVVLVFMAVYAQAQVEQRAYAPEDLRQLSIEDQRRVISLEYSEQSRGQRIPDDQLRFYLDQVNRSNWRFSRIKQDIAESLRGGSANPQPPRPPVGGNREVACESRNNRYLECPTGFRGDAVLVKNLSKVRCVEGQNWGNRNGAVWVDRGCRGRFAESQGSGWGGGGAGNYNVTCSSENNRRTTCAYDARQGRPALLEQLSRAACREGYSWGHAGNQVWVDRGCRGRFGPR